MKKSRRTYNGVHLNKKSNTQDVVEQSLTSYLYTPNLQVHIMNDRQHFIDYTSLIPIIGIFVLIRVTNDQLVTMVTSHVLCGVLFCILISRILRVEHIDVVLLWLGGILLWLWYWFRLESGTAVMETVEIVVG